ncbi:hypothetical protein VTN77DRAFT_1004 [Rasamsonia byssochlamydoides]|uniref:uncharacterized protein n=1 Tax=Rasamsonia byssochlamydoides TaxID=89139 RepID=UPI0037424B27
MSRVKEKVREAKSSARTAASPFEENRHEEEDDFDRDQDHNEPSDEEVPEKDETEKRLEKLLFGDDEGFHEALKSHRRRQSTDIAMRSGDEDASEDDEGAEDDQDMDDVADADLFFLDSGTAETPGAVVPAAATPSDEEETDEFGQAVWVDSDDERLTVSLAGNQRLRKLRVTESEDLISGKEYIRRLRRQYLRLHPTPEWANPERNVKRRKRAGSMGSIDSDEVSSVDEMDTDDESEMSTQPLAKLLQGASDLLKLERNKTGEKRRLRQEVIEIQRLKDVGGNQPSSIDSLSFHPHYPLLLSSGPASTLFLHHISPDAPSPNLLLTSLHIRHTPIHTSAFLPPTGNRIFASGRRRYFHIWDLDTGKVEKVKGMTERKEEQKSMERFKLSPCGRYIGLVGTARKGGGLINVLNASTGKWIAQVRVDGRGGVADFAWWSDGEGMCVASKNGEISEWDGRLRRVVARWTDEGAVGTTVLSLGGSSGRTQLGGDRWVAVGSSSGIVNIYDRRPWQAAVAQAEASKKKDIQEAVPRNPKPVRMLDQLTTPISHLVFSADGQLLVMASRWKRDALRLIHLPSCTVYRNWPTSNTPFGRISSVAISPESNILAVANEQGKIRLWEIHG